MTIKTFNLKQFIIVTLVTSIWIHISEIFRYEVFVKPKFQLLLEQVSKVITVQSDIIWIWVCWDTLLAGVLVFVFWLYSQVFGNTNRSVLISSTVVWLAVFVVYWLATANMGLSEWSMLKVTLPLSWLEMCVGTFIAAKLYKKYKNY